MRNMLGETSHEGPGAARQGEGQDGAPGRLYRHPFLDRARPRARPGSCLLGSTIIGLVSAGCVLGTMLGLAGAHWWMLDLLAHFQIQYALLLIPAAFYYAWRERWIALALVGVALCVNGAQIAPLYLGKPAPASMYAPRLEVMMLHAGERDDPAHRARTLTHLQSIAAGPLPDVIVILGVTEPWLAPLTTALPGYRLTGAARDDGFGIAVLARAPVESSAVVHLVDAPIPAVELVVARGDERFAVLAIHAPPPRGQEMAHLRDHLLDAVGRWVPAQSAHPIVVGNLNTTLWSHALRKLLDTCHLVSSQVGFGAQATWPAARRPLAIPIDQVLHGNSLTTIARRVGPSLGSNHRMLHVALAPRWLP